MQFMPEFVGHGVFVQWHISSQHNEMSHKSVVVSLLQHGKYHIPQVPLGVQLKKQNKLKEMEKYC